IVEAAVGRPGHAEAGGAILIIAAVDQLALEAEAALKFVAAVDAARKALAGMKLQRGAGARRRRRSALVVEMRPRTLPAEVEARRLRSRGAGSDRCQRGEPDAKAMTARNHVDSSRIPKTLMRGGI